MKSIERQIFWRSLACVAIVMCIVGSTIIVWFRQATLAQIDESLKVVSGALGEQLEWTTDGLKWEGDFNSFAKSHGQADFHFAAFSLEGEERIRSDDSITSIPKNPQPSGFHYLKTSIGSFRLLRSELIPQWEDEQHDESFDKPTARIQLVVFASLDRWQAMIRRISLTILGASFLGLVAIGVLLTWSVRRGLASVTRISNAIEHCDMRHLALSIKSSEVPVELEGVVDRMRDLLARIRSSNEREKAFSANVAHELRTPLAGIASTLEVALLRPRDPSEYQVVLQDCLNASRGLSNLVNQLLSLASLEGGQSFSLTSVCLSDVVFRSLREYEKDFATKQIDFVQAIQSQLFVTSNESAIRIVLQNLLDNAAEYCDEGGQIDVCCQRIANLSSDSEREIEIRIVNTCRHLEADMASRIGERFWRGDSSRTETGNHFGLGLALCKELCSAIGMRVEFKVDSGNFQSRLYIKSHQ